MARAPTAGRQPAAVHVADRLRRRGDRDRCGRQPRRAVGRSEPGLEGRLTLGDLSCSSPTWHRCTRGEQRRADLGLARGPWAACGGVRDPRHRRDLGLGAANARRRDGAGRGAWEGVRFEYTPGHPVLRTCTCACAGDLCRWWADRAGKSTLLALLARFADPQAGGSPWVASTCASPGLPSLRRHIAMGSARRWCCRPPSPRNIEIGRPGATFDESRRRCPGRDSRTRSAPWPDGYHPVVGEQG